MKRNFSRSAQTLSNIVHALDSSRFHNRVRAKQMFSSLGYALLMPLWTWLRADKWIEKQIYGQNLRMPAEHSLPGTVAEHPLYNQPLAEAVAALGVSNKLISVIDVGANIGETMAVIERRNPDRCVCLCVEPSAELAEFCRFNQRDNPRVLVEEAFVGEDEGRQVKLVDDGRANPSTRPADSGGAALHRLDTLTRDFVARFGVDLIKTDTEGYDFTVLRSAEATLRAHRPALYFEWFPEALRLCGEQPGSIFEFLGGLGYSHWVFFSAEGSLYCQISDPPRRFLEVLEEVTLQRKPGTYFDVFGSVDESVCNRLADSYLFKPKPAQASTGQAIARRVASR